MSNQVDGRSTGPLELTEDDLGKYLLHYLLSSRGICEESVLLTALRKLCDDPAEDSGQLSVEEWQNRLSDVIKRINVKLNVLDFKVIQISHGMGKTIVGSKSRQSVTANLSRDTDLPITNRFYVYIDVGAVEETKLATPFSQKEVEFIKFALQEMGRSGFKITEGQVPTWAAVAQEVDRVRRPVLERTETAPTSWDKYTTFAVGSSQLTQHKTLNPQEIEEMIVKLCEYKWFCSNEEGEISLDVRCIAELEDALISTYGFPVCENCNRLAIYGVMCLHDDSDPAMWHVDCYQYQITHRHRDCTTCNRSLVTNGIYVI